MTHKQRFSICKECAKFNSSTWDLVKNVKMDENRYYNEKLRIVLEKSFHLENVRNDRRCVYYWQLFSELHREKSLFWYVDRMDQAKTMMPSSYRMVKGNENCTKLEISILAYLCSEEPYGTFFWNAQNVAKNSSYHCYTDYLLLNKIKTLSGSLPPKLIICMDNASSENKNTIYLQFCMLLVGLRIFNEIQWIFLPVGHTHSLVDQVFSVFSRKISSNLNGFIYIEQLFDVFNFFFESTFNFIKLKKFI